MALAVTAMIGRCWEARHLADGRRGGVAVHLLEHHDVHPGQDRRLRGGFSTSMPLRPFSAYRTCIPWVPGCWSARRRCGRRRRSPGPSGRPGPSRRFPRPPADVRLEQPSAAAAGLALVILPVRCKVMRSRSSSRLGRRSSGWVFDRPWSRFSCGRVGDAGVVGQDQDLPPGVVFVEAAEELGGGVLRHAPGRARCASWPPCIGAVIAESKSLAVDTQTGPWDSPGSATADSASWASSPFGCETPTCGDSPPGSAGSGRSGAAGQALR